MKNSKHHSHQMHELTDIHNKHKINHVMKNSGNVGSKYSKSIPISLENNLFTMNDLTSSDKNSRKIQL